MGPAVVAASPPDRCELVSAPGRTDRLTLKFKPMHWRVPRRTAVEFVSGVMMSAFGGMVTIAMLAQVSGRLNDWIPPLLMGGLFLGGSYFVLKSLRSMLSSAKIEIHGRYLSIEESFWPKGVYRSQWDIHSIEFFDVLVKQEREQESKYLLPNRYRLQIRGKDGSEDLILFGRPKVELVWAWGVLDGYLKDSDG